MREGDIFDEKTIREHLRTGWAGRQVVFRIQVDSTNALAERLSKEGAPHGTLVVAREQTAGRGRLGRNWIVPSGTSLTMSLLLRPEISPDAAPMLTLVMGLSAALALEDLDLFPGIKWPNDVVLSRKKVCGILTEMNLEGSGIREVIIGVGLNVNVDSFPPELPDKATSLSLETGKSYDKNILISRILERFEKAYDEFCKTSDLKGLMEDYNRLLVNRGELVKVLDQKDPYEGRALGINELGELLVARENGTVERVRSGEVSVRGLYSYV